MDEHKRYVKGYRGSGKVCPCCAETRRKRSVVRMARRRLRSADRAELEIIENDSFLDDTNISEPTEDLIALMREDTTMDDHKGHFDRVNSLRDKTCTCPSCRSPHSDHIDPAAPHTQAAEAEATITSLSDQVVRYHDLVRHSRGPLYDAGLLDDAEYAALAGDHGSVARLVTYDQMRTQLAAINKVVGPDLVSTDGGPEVEVETDLLERVAALWQRADAETQEGSRARDEATRLRNTLRRVLECFVGQGYPGCPDLRTGWVSRSVIDQMLADLGPEDGENPVLRIPMTEKPSMP